MDWKRIAPWNWFKDEALEHATQMPVRAHAPSDPFLPVRAEIERLFDNTIGPALLGMPRVPANLERLQTSLRPSVDIAEGKKAYTVRAELPGV